MGKTDDRGGVVEIARYDFVENCGQADFIDVSDGNYVLFDD